MAHLFISHSTRDGGVIAQQLAAALEAAGHRCWIAPRDVKPGVPYPGQIVTAIEACSGLVLVVTPAANESPDVLQEIQLANTARKVIAPVIVNATTPGPDMRYYIGVRHQLAWSDADAVTAELLRSFDASLPHQRAIPVALDASGSLFDVLMIAAGNNKTRVIKTIAKENNLEFVQAWSLSESFPPICVGKALPRVIAENLRKTLAEQGASMLPLAPTKP